MERLLQAVQELSFAVRLEEVQAIVGRAARDVAACDGATFVLRDGEQCFYADENAIAPLWKGMRFPIEACISGWAMLNREHAVIPDIYLDERIPHEAYRPTFVRSLVMTPIRTMAPAGAIGAYWKDRHDPTDEEISLLRGLADATSLALEKVSIHAELEQEVALASEVRRMAQADELTGLLNRRGFAESVAASFADDAAMSGSVAFVDIDGLKRVNDEAGHAAGDQLIVAMAAELRSSVRPQDLVGRLGGDEFAVFAARLDCEALLERIDSAVGGLASAGTAPLAGPERLQEALLVADARMYEAKRARTSALQ
ncbi:MAG TPA: sensor domain-containing diguanylate cyclase [Nocardioides sp.]|nr:sensor domain-containing diguanylate cyclase [Nocardioides sp.]